MERGFGGPVWHCSVADTRKPFPDMEAFRGLAYEILDGRGDPRLGEWEEPSHIAFHLKRRLAASEQMSVGDVTDIRGTSEGYERFLKMQKFLPVGAVPIAMREMGYRIG